ncbi:MAG: glycoside hydrolase family 15 protein [Thermodesulfobacteriota bacterium]|nr:glycoside hydrolase family 15 protein [Thermodesulfobacteriota bacterium]
MYKKISDYGIIGDLHSTALIGLDGSIDWMCLPHIDSPSCFGALLDDKKGGSFSISPIDDWDSVVEYIPETNILQTRFRTRTGVMKVTDFMPVCACGREEMEEESHELYRLIEILQGKVNVRVTFDPRFDYGRSDTRLKKHKKGIIAKGNNESLTLLCSREMNIPDDTKIDKWTLSDGDRVWLHLIYGKGEPLELDKEKAEKAFADTETYWKGWLNISETGRAIELGPYKQMVERSALVLKLLYYDPTGTISAAATTSLPEEIGGERNWDYRFTWVRDTSFTLQALFNLGHLSETEGYIRWIEKLISEHGAGSMQIMYGLRGEEDLTEQKLDHLDGYKGSRPVRISNGAAKQKQLDIYGELMDAALKLSDYVGKIDAKTWPFLHDICDYVVEHWRDKDSGIWEVRGGLFDFVYSKVMCWVALDRGIIIAKRYGFPADLKKWQKTGNEIREEVLSKGWNDEKESFAQHYETNALDSSNLLIPILGFLPFTDHRVISTLKATQNELSHKGFLYRYIGQDGLSGEEGTFLLSTFWLINNLVALGIIDEAEALINRMEGIANHLGLFSEEYDVHWRESLGNFPQAFTHIGYINSVIALQQAKQNNLGHEKKKLRKTNVLLTNKIVLNNGEPCHNIPPKEIASYLKNSMNVLRGAFFDTQKGRISYELMQKSEVYAEYLELSYTLKNIDLHELKTTAEQIAFWVNMYNVVVIHGVIELGIRDSVKEVRNFFRRIQYQIGDMFFCPEDIEHGILRGNRRPPNSLFKLFGSNDRRLRHSVRKLDPRIHFALVCASSSCPPISFYTPENLDEELRIAGKTFVNGGGVTLNRQNNHLSLSRVFKWYANDFGKTQTERMKYITQYLYDEGDIQFLIENAKNIKLDYQDYDWRLNRY